jgi:tetratricopeptide (TPR) repeat protein
MERERNKLYVVLICAALVLSILIAYEMMRQNGFVNYDDDVYVTDNPHVQSGLTRQSVAWAFTTRYTGNWHPLTWLSHMLDCGLFGLNPLWHHLSSLLLHIANTLLLFWVLRRTTGAIWASAFVAAAFALHPLHVESVAWVSERKDVLSGFFWMLTIAAYVRYMEQPGIGRYLLIVLAFCLGLMSKPMLVTLPFVLLLLDYWPLDRFLWGHRFGCQGRSNLRLIIEKIPLFVLSAASSVATYVIQQGEGAMDLGKRYSLSVRISNALICYLGYIIKMFCPRHLAVLYPHPGDSLPLWQPIVSLLILFIISAGVIYTGRRWRYLAVGWFWYLGTLVPVIGLVQVGAQAMADRYTYLPSIGIFIMVAWGAPELIAKWCYRRTILGICAGIVLAALLICTRLQVRYWRNNFELFGHAVAVTENNYLMHDSYGGALFEKGQLEEAIRHFKEALRINPRYLSASANIGIVLLREGKIDEAVKVLTEVVGSKGNYPKAHNYLGLAYAKKGEFGLAVQNYNEAVRLKPDYVEAIANLGIALKEQGKVNEAIKEWHSALQLKPDEPNIHYNMGLAMAEQGNYDEAIRHFSAALAAEPDWAEAHYNLGCAYYQQGKFDLTIKHCVEALQLKPNYPNAHYNLGLVMVRQGKYDDAIKHFARVVELDPNNVDALGNAAWLLATISDVSVQDAAKAIELAERACELTGYKEPAMLDTLAAAYAAAGRFNDAISTAEQAINLAKASRQEILSSEIQNRIKLYQANQRYRQK